MKRDIIAVRKLLRKLFKGRKIIAVCMLVGLIIAYGLYCLPGFYGDYYVAGASMVVRSGYTENERLSQKSLNTLRGIMLSDTALDVVIDDLKLNINAAGLRRHITISAEGVSDVLRIRVRYQHPLVAANIANLLLEIAPQAAVNATEGVALNILDKARVPSKPYHEEIGIHLYLAVGGAAGLLIGMVIAFVLGLYKICGRRQLVKKTGLRCLGEIPNIRLRFSENLLLSDGFINSPTGAEFSDIAEQLIYAGSMADFKKLIVAGTTSDNGFVAANTAVALSQAGKRVLLVDFGGARHGADILFSVTPKSYIDDVIAGRAQLCDAAAAVPATRIHILLSKVGGQRDIISSDGIDRFVESACDDYDFIIIDAPPVLAGSKTMSLVKHSDGVLLVVGRRVFVSEVLDAKRRLESVGALVFGAVLSGLRFKLRDRKQAEHKNAALKKRTAKRKKRRNPAFKRVLYILLFVLLLFALAYFATRTGDRLASMSNGAVSFVLDKMRDIGLLSDKINIANGVPEETYLSFNSRHWTNIFENWINYALFLLLALTTVKTFSGFGARPAVSFALSFNLNVILAVANELYQSYFVEGRTYELRDLCFSFAGIASALLILGIGRLFGLINEKKNNL